MSAPTGQVSNPATSASTALAGLLGFAFGGTDTSATPSGEFANVLGGLLTEGTTASESGLNASAESGVTGLTNPLSSLLATLTGVSTLNAESVASDELSVSDGEIIDSDDSEDEFSVSSDNSEDETAADATAQPADAAPVIIALAQPVQSDTLGLSEAVSGDAGKNTVLGALEGLTAENNAAASDDLSAAPQDADSTTSAPDNAVLEKTQSAEAAKSAEVAKNGNAENSNAAALSKADIAQSAQQGQIALASALKTPLSSKETLKASTPKEEKSADARQEDNALAPSTSDLLNASANGTPKEAANLSARTSTGSKNIDGLTARRANTELEAKIGDHKPAASGQNTNSVSSSAFQDALASTTGAGEKPISAATKAFDTVKVLPHQTVAEAVGISVSRHMQSGKSEVVLRMDPPELGRIDVKMGVNHDGKVTAVVSADNQSTFDLLRRDSHALERALADAGLKTDSGSLSFNLRQDDGQGQKQASSQGDRSPSNPWDKADQNSETTDLSVRRPVRAAQGILDLIA